MFVLKNFAFFDFLAVPTYTYCHFDILTILLSIAIGTREENTHKRKYTRKKLKKNVQP